MIDDDAICTRVQDTKIFTMLEGIDSDNFGPIVRSWIIGKPSGMSDES